MFEDVIDFWFDELEPPQWFQKSEELDQIIERRFSETLNKAKAGELFDWRQTALGALAEIIVLDQFSRNIFRDTPESFAADTTALVLSQTAIAQKQDSQLSKTQRVFLYMPFMHSESKIIHTESMKLYESLDIQVNLDYEIEHKKIIDRFGRYPHRNVILGRQSTSAELEFLKQSHSGF